jgi:hypothetical protein
VKQTLAAPFLYTKVIGRLTPFILPTNFGGDVTETETCLIVWQLSINGTIYQTKQTIKFIIAIQANKEFAL